MGKIARVGSIWFLLLSAALPGSAARAAEGKKDAPRQPLLAAKGSVDLLLLSRKEIEPEPDGAIKADLLGAIGDLEEGARNAAPEDRQTWIDSHLGTLNATVRALGSEVAPPLTKAAAKAAARLNSRAQRWEEAREFAEKALGYDPEDRDALVSRSQAATGLGDYSRAYIDAERASKLAPDWAEAHTARALAAYGLGNYLQAVEDARRALALDPEDKSAFSIMKLSQGRTRKVPDFEKTETKVADSVEREYHGMMQQLNQAEEKRLLPVEEPAPASTARLISAAGSKLSVKDYWGAIEEADKALAADPDNAQALYVRAAAHNLIGEYGEAARDATRGLTIKPGDVPLRDARAWAYNRMGRYLDATADAHYALEIDPRDAYAFANRGYADEQRGDFEAMLEDYRAAASINPQFEPDYRDAARRHGLAPRPLSPRRDLPKNSRGDPRRIKTLATILVSSLLGGLLIAMGILHVGSAVKERKAAPPGSLEAGYDVGKPLGQGGMGVVYEAYDRKLKRRVAIKMLRDEFKLDDAAKADFLQEARTVAELHHPAIVDIHNIVEDGRGLYLVFERLRGRTLDQILAERKRLTLPEIKKVLKPVCEALGYAHDNGVVHRDLKPSNVMLLEGGGVKVLDFGISRHAARAGKAVTQDTVGTPHYMAPEQEYGLVRKENDVFSLGAVLYEMATGLRPFAEGAAPAKVARDYARASSRVPGLPPQLDGLIDRALEPDADKRLSTPADFWRELAALPDAAV